MTKQLLSRDISLIRNWTGISMKHLIQSRHWLFALILTVSCLTLPTAQAGESSLLESVASKLGISSEQASGALGSLFQLAQKEMGSGDFSQLSEIIPNMDGLLETAPKMEESSTSKVLSGLGGLGGSLGKTSQSASNITMLTSALSKLGIDAEQAAPLLETVYDYVQSEGGQALMEKLKSAIG